MLIRNTALGVRGLKPPSEGVLCGGRPRVVVVDDVPSMLDAICFLLEHEALVEVVGRAQDGLQALQAALALRPDLVLMDVFMPNMNGFEAATILTETCPNTKIVLMSGEESPEMCAQAFASGADAFVFKLHFPEEFVLVLQKLFSAREAVGPAR